MGTESKISVVIPCYNASQWIAEAVESVLAQTMHPQEILVVDDGSTDASAEVVARFTDQGVQYIHQQNQGVAAARNTGILAARGEFIALLDADDVWHPDKLETQHLILTRQPELALVGTGVFDWPGPVPDLSSYSSPALHQVGWERLVARNHFTTSSVLIRRSSLASLASSPFDIDLRGPEDYDLWLRLAELAPVANIDWPLTGYRYVPTGLGKRVESMEAGVKKILRKVGKRGGWRRRGAEGLRRRAYAGLHYTSAYMYSVSGRQSKALARILRSFAMYPFPLQNGEVRGSFARPKLLGVCLLRLLGLKDVGGRESGVTANDGTAGGKAATNG